jgi:hypothetical protein
MYAKILAAATGLILGSVVGLAGDNSRIPDHQPRQTAPIPTSRKPLLMGLALKR